MRRLFEAAARRRPLVVAVEDIHWAEPTLLDVLEHVATHARDVPLLLVFLARPELLKRQLSSPMAHPVLLSPLSEGESERLLQQLDPGLALEADERTRGLGAAEGNPFFLEQLVAVRQETGANAATPGTIQVVLAARIDALAPAERAVIDCAAVEGRQFHRGVVAELLAARHVDALDDDLGCPRRARPDAVWRARICPARRGTASRTSSSAKRSTGSFPKTQRADLHERYARWLEAQGPGRRPRPRRDHRLSLRAGLPMLDRPASGQRLRPAAAGAVGRATSERGRARRARTRRRAGGGQSPRAHRQPVRRRRARAGLAAARARFCAHPGGEPARGRARPVRGGHASVGAR